MEIKYLPTGNIFDLPEDECKRIYKESPFNYEILDKHFDVDTTKLPNTSVASKVLVQTEDVAPNAKMNFDALKEIAIKKGIKEEQLVDEKGKNIKKADLVKLIEEFVPEIKEDDTDEENNGEDGTEDKDETKEDEE